MEQLYGTKKRKGMKLCYFLTRQEIAEKNRTLFGIKVVKMTDKAVEEEITGAVSESEEMIRRLLGQLCENQITPWVLNEVVDDLVS